MGTELAAAVTSSTYCARLDTSVIASDLVDYGDPTHFYGRDFLMELGGR